MLRTFPASWAWDKVSLFPWGPGTPSWKWVSQVVYIRYLYISLQEERPLRIFLQPWSFVNLEQACVIGIPRLQEGKRLQVGGRGEARSSQWRFCLSLGEMRWSLCQTPFLEIWPGTSGFGGAHSSASFRCAPLWIWDKPSVITPLSLQQRLQTEPSKYGDLYGV